MAEQSLQLEQANVLTSSRRRRGHFQFKQLPSYLFLGAWSLFTIFALSWVVLASLKTNREVFREPFTIPAEPQFVNYQRVWENSQVGQSFVNSLIIVGLSVLFILLVSAPASYILSRARFRGRNLLTMIYIAGIGIPYPLLFIPLFAMLAGLKLINTMPGLILVYVSLSVPFTVYILTGFFSSLPQELEDSAVIDGATDFQVFRKIMLPLARPGLITAAIFNFIGLWNEFQLALIFIQDPDKRPLSLSLYALKNSMTYSGDWAGLFAGVVIVVVPTVLLFILLSERMISGITLGSVK
ncbi:MAG: carbohydrate ABC transporter permease [Chloroflexota bacterium]|nr:MAG: carbohydrate ABC transporter permease [Chloroflexota bacterium]